MSGQELMNGLSHIDERFVDEAEHFQTRSETRGHLRVALAAACLCVLILGIWNIQKQNAGDDILYHTTPDTASNQLVMDSNSELVIFEDTPSVILRIEEWTDNGFVGTVARQVDSDILPVGAEVTAVYSESMMVQMDSAPDFSRKQFDTIDREDLYVVRVQLYDEETHSIVIEAMSKAVD